MIYRGYEAVIGLEVHVELKTATKIFCACRTDFGAPPNTQCCPVCMGMPGTLPILNSKAVDLAIIAGLATNCVISCFSGQDRKNYFYPDLPKGYQISQYDRPLCSAGYVDIETPNGEKRIGITRIHIEEDAGKLIHDEKLGTLIDCNRCGVPLIEIVSEPDIRSAEEAKAYLRKLRSIMVSAGVSDCKMNEGSMRCDVNLSVRKTGETALGTRTEMKNINSFRFVARAIEYEFKRQVDLIESGGTVVQETRKFDDASGKTFTMRVKEEADDYRFFRDPDLPEIYVSDEKITELRALIPPLPDERKMRYMERYALSAHDSEMLAGDRNIADFFENAAALTKYPIKLANLITGEVFRLLGEDEPIQVSAENLAALADLLGGGEINVGTAKKLLGDIWKNDENPRTIVERENLFQINDEIVLVGLITEAAQKSPKLVADYKNGKKNALKALIGQVMAKTHGRANPVTLSRLAEETIDNM